LDELDFEEPLLDAEDSSSGVPNHGQGGVQIIHETDNCGGYAGQQFIAAHPNGQDEQGASMDSDVQCLDNGKEPGELNSDENDGHEGPSVMPVIPIIHAGHQEAQERRRAIPSLIDVGGRARVVRAMTRVRGSFYQYFERILL
jgi:hypothetical protein